MQFVSKKRCALRFCSGGWCKRCREVEKRSKSLWLQSRQTPERKRHGAKRQADECFNRLRFCCCLLHLKKCVFGMRFVGEQAHPSVPFGWRVYTALCLYKDPPHLQAESKATEEERMLLGYRRMHLQHLSWCRLSTRDPDASAKVIALFQLRSLDLNPSTNNPYPDRNPGQLREGVVPRQNKFPPSSLLGDCFFFAAPSLHRAQQFLLSNPKSRAG